VLRSVGWSLLGLKASSVAWTSSMEARDKMKKIAIDEKIGFFKM
jgi:hypothetical protein